MGCGHSVCTRGTPSSFEGGGQAVRDVFKVGKLLGSGAFGQVRECVSIKTNEAYAMKIMLKSSQERGHWSNENMFRREIDVLASLDHPYIVKYHSFYEDKNYLYAVLEKCEGGELFDQILQQGCIAEARSTTLAFQMLTAINYVHSQGVVHRDVKAENFLFSTDSNDSDIKLIDFGMSERLSAGQVLTDVCGSPHYLAPELIRRKYGFKADVWALGVLVYLMLYGDTDQENRLDYESG
ncbi:putative calmodulin-dependent protein kinase [Gregarina niphandrodes]|uniref:non-specific serine/threonine protein kinase n=1 Tax=Gregarina niphandrodes TaxID=110365 RepID=A0A023BDF0_GRENI|nr:putative calmodulin-dependent protein kinase [Gregarina niphandrodes]EZG88152.1 putative calmodulin-dependent protein kinase [Gregarina niphandrodes]|eukprot:XP_011128619.1 putative calmodulin-dependent protein kinase [Gregarina niphandrodes]